MSTDFINDPLWYKDAVIYELHVRSFYDTNNDGYGDFAGLREKLPYLESLGVNTLWLLPFLESPLRDDGYDTADYLKILPVHGTLNDFQDFLDEAHKRGMRVITELVLNHTSDQHPWFQEARNPHSPRHNWYVWSDTTEKYREARIIFTDTELSNWTWDRQAQKYYWHRFFSHQPDLNYDNPEVHEAMREVMFYWFDLGVDGLRLDAVPYLYEREGTNCENLSETIQFIRNLRKAIEARYGPGRVLLAEANQWPEDTLPYFAGGEGVQMAFNFPIMPRMYMALRRENRRPLVEMLELTADIPAECQWAIFLRNHDELTLEMVTDEERDYLYHEYGSEARFRINVGIRRRLAPLLGNERRRIELMNALLLSLKGSPVIYYGDEIGMGDDPFLGDRNGVRTPMQWSPDKNGGFSRAPHHKLFMPTISRGLYSYEFINVDDAELDPHSLLNFMRRLLTLRKQHARVFGRGSIEIVPVENQSVLVFLRHYEDEQMLIVANLSRFAQSVFLPVSPDYQDLVPVELFSQTRFPPLGTTPYHLPVGHHGFYWFLLEPQPVSAALADARQAGAEDDLPVLHVVEGLQNLLVRTMVEGRGMEHFERMLPEYVRQQRWFGAKGEPIERIEIDDAVRLQAYPFPIYLSTLHVHLSGRSELYVLPLAVADGEKATRLFGTYRTASLAWIERPSGRGLLYDATVDPSFWITLFNWWTSGGKGRSLKGLYLTQVDANVQNGPIRQARPLSVEQSNSSAILDDRFFIKLYRRLEPGTNPETELLDYLTRAGFKFIPRLYGTVSFKQPARQYALGILQQALEVEADGWTYALDMMGRFLDRARETTIPADGLPVDYTDAPPVWLEEIAPEMLSLADVLGTRTAELHITLNRAEAPALKSIKGAPGDVKPFVDRVLNEIEQTRTLLERQHLSPALMPDKKTWDRAAARLKRLAGRTPARERIRVHGDYHLGQIIRAQGEFYIMDFEGEPARSLEARRTPDDALRDVAGMLRSLEYAALVAWHDRAEQDTRLEAWTGLLVRWCEATFLNAYYGAAEGGPFLLPENERADVLWAYLFDKALYEVRYELNHRPDWVWLPLRGLARLLHTLIPSSSTNEPIDR